MNKHRRSELKNAIVLLSQALQIVTSVCDEEQDALFNIPENLQNSEMYEKIEQTVEELQEAVEHMEQAEENLSNIL